MLNAQLEQKNLLIREGAIIDASIVEPSQRSCKAVDIAFTDREEDDEEQIVTMSYSLLNLIEKQTKSDVEIRKKTYLATVSKSYSQT